MTNFTQNILGDIKVIYPHLTDEEAQHLLESVEAYCEIIIDSYMENEGADDDHLLRM